MKKSIIYLVTLAFLAVSFTSCEKSSAGLTGKVDYVVLKLLGDSQIMLSLGDTYVEPGWTATDKGKDVHDKVDVTIVNMVGKEVDTIATDKPGIFTITYSATSEDNMFISEQRQVLVFDPTLTMSLKGVFAVDFDKSEYNGDSNGTTWTELSAYYTSSAWKYAQYSEKEIDINIKEVVPGIYNVDCLIGGYYTFLRGYGGYMVDANEDPSLLHYYSMGGMIILNADKSLDLVSSENIGFEDSLEDFSGKYDDATNTLDIHSFYNGGKDFHIVMVKK